VKFLTKICPTAPSTPIKLNDLNNPEQDKKDPHLILVGQVNAALSLRPGVEGPVAGGRAGPV